MIKKLKKGFTLVELIVVMAIIAILSTVAVVSYSAIVKKAEQSKAQTEFNQVVNVIKVEAANSTTFTLDHEGHEDKLTLGMYVDAQNNNLIEFAFEVAVDDVDVDKSNVFDAFIEDLDLGKLSGELDLNIGTSKLVYTVPDIDAITLDVHII